MNSSARRRSLKALRSRDGEDCFYCGLPLGDDITVEHLLPRSMGGTDDLHNLVMAHLLCNRLGASRPIMDKVILRDLMRARVQSGKDQT